MQELSKPKPGYKFVKSYFGKYEEIPEDWEFKRISEIGEIIGGGTPDSRIKEYWGGDIPWAVPTDITDLKGTFIEKTERLITQKGLKNSSARLLPKGTVLITSRATIGSCAINTVPMATNQGFQSLYVTLRTIICLYFMRLNFIRIDCCG
jgi:type I restriction enzyme, S subunit